MKLQKMFLSALALCLLLAANALADTTVTISGVHLCCGKCSKAAHSAVDKIADAEAEVNNKAGTITIKAANDARAQKALNALSSAGFYGNSDSNKIKIAKNTAQGTSQRTEFTGFHNCCGKCAKAIEKAANSVEGVAGIALKKKDLVVEGDFKVAAIIRALNKAGLQAKVK